MISNCRLQNLSLFSPINYCSTTISLSSINTTSSRQKLEEWVKLIDQTNKHRTAKWCQTVLKDSWMCYQSDDIKLLSDRGSLSTWSALTAKHNNGEHHRRFKQVVSAQNAVTLELFSALNIFLPITASLGNALILIGLDKVTSIYPQTKPFLSMSGGYWPLSISALDFLYNDSMQPKSSLVLQRWTLNVLKTIFAKFLEFQVGFFCVVSTLTLTAINGERLLALFFGVLFLVS